MGWTAEAKTRNVVLLATAGAWAWLLAAPHPVHCAAMAAEGATWRMFLAMNSPVALAVGWAAMLVATMLPTLIPAICHIRRRSFAQRRARSVALFLAGYGAVWMAAGTVLTALAVALQTVMPLGGALACVLLVALLWQITPARQQCLNRNHAHTELAAFGLAADLAALRFGVVHGTWCVGSCWAWMLVPMLLPQGHLLAMAAVGAVIFCERLEEPAAPAWRLRGLGGASRLLVARARLAWEQ